MRREFIALALLFTSASENVLKFDDSDYNFSPRSRTILPKAVFRQSGATIPAQGCFPITLSGPGAFVVLDFGQEVGGFTTLNFGHVVNGTIGMAYSESTNYASCPSDAVAACADGVGQAGAGDHSNGGSGPDGTLTTGSLSSHSNFTTSVSHMRGGFRYLNLFLEDGGDVEIIGVSLHFTASPTMESPADYKNHFHSSDEMLNKIWYASAYTVQMCSIDPSHGRQWGPPNVGWNNAVLIGPGKSLLVDGAKRDRTVWPGDMGVSSATAFATLGDVESSRNSLTMLYALQSPSGQLPYVGPEVFCKKPWGDYCGNDGSWGSDTYHLWALIGTSNVFSYSEHVGGGTWLRGIWEKYKAAVTCSLRKVGSNGLMKVDQTADWQRGGQGGFNVAANAILAEVLATCSMLAQFMNDTSFKTTCKTGATKVKAAMNELLWDDGAGAFRDNPDSTLHPQDGNSIVLWFNITSEDRAKRMTSYLQSHWSPIGAPSPEWTYEGKTAIGTFSGSMEVLGHAANGRADLAVELIRRQWGYMLNSPNSTQSTFWEGFQANGQYAFQGIYMSHAHGWAAGPGAVLSFYVLGLRPDRVIDSNASGRYVVAPQFAGLTFCIGSMDFGAGRVHASWRKIAHGHYHLSVDARDHPHGVGRIGLPAQLGNGLSKNKPQILVGTSFGADAQPLEAEVEDQRVWYELRGGHAHFEVTSEGIVV